MKAKKLAGWGWGGAGGVGGGMLNPEISPFGDTMRSSEWCCPAGDDVSTSSEWQHATVHQYVI